MRGVVALLALAFSLASLGPACAAPPTPYSWTGVYVGGHAGYGWDSETVGIQSGTLLLGALINIGTIPSSQTINPHGLLGGAQLGFNYQLDRFVFGAETDISLTDFEGSSSVTNPGPILPFATYTTSAEQRMKWFGTLRGRLGVAATDSLLIYATGGLAYGETEYTANIHRQAILIKFDVPVSATETKTGWTIGGGLEYALAKNWSVKGEYLYYDLGGTTITGNLTTFGVVTAATATYSFETRGHIVRLGINYKF